MARYTKKGLDYFSHDTNMQDDIKVKLLLEKYKLGKKDILEAVHKLLLAKYKLEGYGVFNLLLENLYKESYFLTINEDYLLLFSSQINYTIEKLTEMIEYMVEKGLFNRGLYNKYSVLTSDRTQTNYILACSRRKEIYLIEEYTLIDPDNIMSEYDKKHSKIIYVSINDINGNINDLNVHKKKQSKVNKSKVNKSKDKIIIQTYWRDNTIPPMLDWVLGEMKLCNFPDPEIESEKFYNYYESNGWVLGGSKMVNWKSAIKNWYKNYDKSTVKKSNGIDKRRNELGKVAELIRNVTTDKR